jgi:tetratricopeptide (TPR) repeat protein
MEAVMHESTLDEIQDIYKAGEPNTNHVFIAKLVQQRYITTICTTNFDLLIEKAFEEEGLIKDKDFLVYSSEADFKRISWDNKKIKVIKIHGCVTKSDEMGITMQQIASEKYSIARRSVIENIFTNRIFSHVLVMGYSCSDIDLTPHIESIKNNQAEIIFIEHQQQNPKSPLPEIKQELIKIKKTKNPFKDYPGERIFADTNYLVKHLWQATLKGNYYFTTYKKIPWEQEIDKWYKISEKDSGSGVRHHIASRLLYDVAAFAEAKKHYKKGISIALKEKNIKAYAAEMGNMAMAHNALGEYDQAKFCLSESITLCKRIGNTQGVLSQLQVYGNVLYHTGENEEAIEYFKEALYYAEKNEDEFGISNILGNMSNVLNRLRRYEEAERSIERALLLSRKLGNIQGESSQLGIMAVTLMMKGRFKESLQLNLQGLEIKKAIGDRQGECMLMANIINVYNALGMTNEAVKAIEDCLSLSRQIKNKQTEIMAMVQASMIGKG